MEKLHIIQMPIETDYHILCKTLSKSKEIVVIVMTAIDKNDEIELDNRRTIKLERGDETFTINPKEGTVYCYGDVDFETDSSDYNVVDGFDFLDHLNNSGIRLQARYNYDNHTCTSNKETPLWTETWSPAEVAQFAHGCLGKPNKIVLFKHIIKHQYGRY